jgi:nicotinamide-nucleotide amidase
MPLDDPATRLATELGRRLRARGWRAATAESCTGGLVAGAITAIAGSSDWFERGFVTYSNAAKSEMLGVPADVIERHGAVSEAVASAMAAGVIANSTADCALAVTGVAGPGGGTATKPVGTVCFGWTARGRSPRTATLHFPGDRAAVRDASVEEALAGLLELLDAVPL